MKDTIKDLILILYIISFFSGVVTITLNIISLKSGSIKVYKKLLYFNVAFFAYLALNFGFFFTRLFNQTGTMSHFFYSLFDISYIIFLFFWINYADELIENKHRVFTKNVILISGTIYVILWMIVYIGFLDNSDAVSGVIGRATSAIAEIVIFVAMIECNIFYAIKAFKLEEDKRRKLLIPLCILISLYFIWFFVYDMDVIFRFIGPRGWMIYPFDAIIILYFSINVVMIVNSFPKVWSNPNTDYAKLNLIDTESAKPFIEAFAAKNQLSSRETEVLFLIVLGTNNNEIARELTISLHTVKRHINNIFRKINVRSRSELVKMLNQTIN
ncbi:MAG: helix-turn-helix transcriptional regulator [Eubacteriales bacterium]